MDNVNTDNRFEKFFIRFKNILKFVVIIILILIFIEIFSFIGSVIHRLTPFDFEHDVFYGGLMELHNNNEVLVKSRIKELRESNQIIYSPYVSYKPIPNYKGDSVNSGSDSLRKNGKKNCIISGKPKKIFTFGGSTMWASGVRDNETIPAYLYEYLCKNGISIEVINYGVFGWSSPSEIIEFQRQVERGNKPDIVIFYDGINDIYSVSRNQEAIFAVDYKTSPGNFDNIKDLNLVEWWAHHSYTHDLLKYLRIIERYDDGLKDQDINESLKNQTVSFYVNQLKIIKSMEETFGFKSFFYWQPSIWQKSDLSEFELTRNSTSKKQFGEDYIEITKMIQDVPEIIDISNVLNNHSQTLFIDEVHISSAGNKIIAEKIGESVMDYLKSKEYLNEMENENKLDNQLENNASINFTIFKPSFGVLDWFN